MRMAALLLAACLLAACAPTPIRSPDAHLLGAQTAREHQLAGKTHWILRARLAISADGDGGSGTLVWQRDRDGFEFIVRAPVTGRSFRLEGGPHGARLEGLEQGVVTGTDARTLLQRTLGWGVPMAQLRYWVRGMRAPGHAAELVFGDNGLPLRLVQSGWTIEYRNWYEDTTPPLPRRVFANRGDDHVRLVITHWSLH